MDYSRYKTIDFKKNSDQEVGDVIEVPQARFAITWGPAVSRRYPLQQLRFPYVNVFSCVALALIGKGKGRPMPKIILGHIDEVELMAPEVGLQGPSSVRIMYDRCGKYLTGIHAYVLNGDADPRLVDHVLKELDILKIPAQLSINQGCKLVMDAVDGKPVRSDCLVNRAKYEPIDEKEIMSCGFSAHDRAFPRFASEDEERRYDRDYNLALDNDRLPFPPPMKNYRTVIEFQPISLAFDLRQDKSGNGIPKNYNRVDPLAPAEPEPRCRAQATPVRTSKGKRPYYSRKDWGKFY